MRRLCVIAFVIGAACSYLNDRPSRRTAEKVHALIRPGMEVEDVISLTEPLVDRTVWALSAENCQDTGNTFGIRFSERDGSYVVETFPRTDDHVKDAGRRLFRTRAQLVEALKEEPLRTCREFALGVGQWSVPFQLNSSGRVERVSHPTFTD